MTILTKANDKKKLLPIATPPIGAAPSAPPSNDAEAAAIIHARHQARARTTTCLVCLMAILVLLMGVLAGVCFYRQYLRERVQRINCFIPYSDRDVDSAENTWVNKHFRDGPTNSYSDAMKLIQNDLNNDGDGDDDLTDMSRDEGIRNLLNEFFNQFRSDFDSPMKDIHSMESEIGSLDEKTIHEKWFKEELEVKDDEEDSYADIKVPDFKDGRRGRFIHDYKNNQTTIIDEQASRCFIYPLDYETTMPPQSMMDIFTKMQNGYYFPDTTTLNKKMRVVLPKLELDDDYVSYRTATVCEGKKIYRLEPLVSGVYKRSIATPLGEEGTFAEYNGKFVTYDLENIHEVQAAEKN